VLPEGLDRDLGRPELILLEQQLSKGRRPGRPVPARDVGDALAGQDRDEPREEVDADVADDRTALVVAEHPRAVHVVGLVLDDRLDEDRDLLGLVLPVGVQRHDDLGAEPERDVIADAERQAAAAADRQTRDERAGGAGGVGRPVLRAVVDDDRDDRIPLDLLGHRVDDRADVLGLVVGGRDRHDLGSVGNHPGGALPVEVALRERLDEEPHAALVRVDVALHPEYEREQHDDGDHQRARQPLTAAGPEVERVEHRVEQVRRDGEQQDRGGDQRGDHEVQPADLPPAVPHDGAREQGDREHAPDNAEREHPGPA
jgi:hypothetical protein